MHVLSMFPGRQHRKCAKICGDTSGNYHPHGEAVIYPTLVHMAQPWAMRERLVDGQGNYGSVEGDPPASMRDRKSTRLNSSHRTISYAVFCLKKKKKKNKATHDNADINSRLTKNRRNSE